MIRISLQLLSPKKIIAAGVKTFMRALGRLSSAAIAYGAAPKDVADLAMMKVRGLAAKDYSEAVKNFSEVEAREIDSFYAERSLDARLRKQEAETRLAEVSALEAELALAQKLNDLGVSLRITEPGRLTLLPTPQPLPYKDIESSAITSKKINDTDARRIPGAFQHGALDRLLLRTRTEKGIELSNEIQQRSVAKRKKKRP